MQQAAIIPSVRAARSTRRVSLIALMKGRRSQAIQSELRARSCLCPTASRCGIGGVSCEISTQRLVQIRDSDAQHTAWLKHTLELPQCRRYVKVR
jgi:hypothetical protein